MVEGADALPIAPGALERHEALDNLDNIGTVFDFFDRILVIQERGQETAVLSDGSIRLM